MAYSSVLITGATGFLGSRLAERLALGTDYSVTAVVHRLSGPGLARLARIPVKLVLADVLDLESIVTAAENCDIIVHLAYGAAGDESKKREITVSGTENILKAALKRNVRKVIYFSTAAVHGQDPKIPIVDELSPFQDSHDIYRESKIEAEKIVWRYHQEYGLPVVVFRPPLLYGPLGAYWTARIVKEIQNGAILVNGGTGAANLVYVDNAIDAILLAMENDAGDGEAFILVDDDNLTWKQVYEAYASLLGSHPPMRNLTLSEIKDLAKGNYPNDLKSWLVTPFLLVPEMVHTCLQSSAMRSNMMKVPWLRFIKKRFSRDTIKAIKHGENRPESTNVGPVSPNPTPLPSKDLIELYASESRFSNEKIKRILGYKQRITFDEALDLIGSWLRYQRLIPE